MTIIFMPIMLKDKVVHCTYIHTLHTYACHNEEYRCSNALNNGSTLL